MPQIVFDKLVKPVISACPGPPLTAGITPSGIPALNATDARSFVIGQIRIEGGGTKTFSSAGGKVYIAFNSLTFANAGTTVRVGIQDINNTTGIPDGTFDTYVNFIGGTNALTTGVNQFTMANGTKNLTNGDWVAIGLHMLSRGGADSLSPHIASVAFGGGSTYKASASTTGAMTLASNVMGNGAISFDDGSFGFIDFTMPGLISNYTVNPQTQFALLFKSPYTCGLHDVSFTSAPDSLSAALNIRIYSDPLGTPVQMATQSIPIYTSMSGNQIIYTSNPFTGIEFVKDQYYAISLHQATTQANFYRWFDFGAGFENLRKGTMLGTDWSLATASLAGGVFTQDTSKLPPISFSLKYIDVPGGSGGNITF